MAKKIGAFIMLLASCAITFGELDKSQVKELKKLASIDSVRSSTDKKNNKKEIMTVEFSCNDYEDLNAIAQVSLRVLVELTDKDKNTYLVEESRRYGKLPETFIGEGEWKLTIPYGKFDRLKVSGYAVQHGIMEGKEFVPFEEECKGAKTVEELEGRSSTPFPEKCVLAYTIWVDKD